MADYYRALRDAFTEVSFFHIYGNLFSLYIADRPAVGPSAGAAADPRELPVVKEALASIDKGGYPEAFARIANLVARREDVPLSHLEAGRKLIEECTEFLPPMPLEAWRRVLGEQQIIATYEPEKAVATLPRLLAQPEDRERLRTLLDRLANDAMFRRQGLTTGQRATFDRVRKALGQPARAAGDGLKRSDRTATVR